MMSLVVCIFIMQNIVSSQRICNITDYGAIGDNKTDNTIFIQSAIRDCGDTDQMGLVLLPQLSNSLNIYICGALWLLSNISVHIEANVTLLATPNKSNISYPYIYTRREGIMNWTHSSLINGGICEEINYDPNKIGDQCVKWKKLENVIISGNANSIINGNGDSGWFNGSNFYNRPCLLNLMWITNLSITNVKLTNSPFWTLHPLFSENILIDNIIIDVNGPNTDGIDPDSCSNITVSNSFISTGDDGIAIKSGKNADGRAVNISTNNAVFRNLTFSNGMGIAIGSETSGNITNISFDDIKLNNSIWGIRIKSCVGRGGIVENITYKKINIHNIQKIAISISEQYYAYNCNETSAYPPTFRNFEIDNLYGTMDKGGAAGEFLCLDQAPCDYIDLRSIDIARYDKGFTCQDVHGKSHNVYPPSCISDN